MKIILMLIGVLCTFTSQAQIGIARKDVSNNSISLQFGDNENKGLILPYVTDKKNITEHATLIFDTSDYKIKYLRDNNSWFDLTVDTTGKADLSIQKTDIAEQPGAKLCISQKKGGTDNTKGILILVDNDKAMVLPKVASPHLNIINPSPGLIAYDTVKKHLAVYNGTVWTFWKP